MPIVSFRPRADRVIQANWATSHAVPYYELLNEVTPPVATDYAEHGGGNTLFETFCDLTATVYNVLVADGEVRIHNICIKVWLSTLESGTVVKVYMALPVTGGVPATIRDNTILNVPGTRILNSVPGLSTGEIIREYEGRTSLRDPSTNLDWTAANIDALVMQFQAYLTARVWAARLDVDFRVAPSVIANVPSHPAQPVGIYQPISWGFENRGEGVQRAYHVRIFTNADYTTAFIAGTIWTTSVVSYDSGIVRSSQNYHDFSTWYAGKKIRGIADGTWSCVIRVAKEYKGSDFWSADYGQTMVVTSYTATLTSPTSGQSYSSVPPAFTATTTIAANRTKGSEWRVYAEPIGGFPTSFDPDLTDQEPAVTHINYGTPATSWTPKLSESLRNGNYRMYVRFQEIDFDDYTPWTYNAFVMNAPTAPAPQTHTYTVNNTTAAVDIALDFHSGALADEIQSVNIDRVNASEGTVPVRVPDPTLESGLRPVGVRLPGTSGAYIRATNSAALHSSAPDVAVGVMMPNWATIGSTFALAARWLPTGNFRSWLFRLKSDRTLEFMWSTNGTATLTATSTTALPAFTNGAEVWLRVQLTITNPYNVKFYYSTDKGLNYNQLGSTVTGGAATSVFDSTTNGYVELGSSASGTADLLNATFTGLTLRSTVAGTIIEGVTFNGPNAPVTTVGPTMTVQGATSSYHYKINFTDYEIPFNDTAIYSVGYVTKTTANTAYKWSLTSLGLVIITKQEMWIKCLEDPTLNMRVLLGDSWMNRDTFKGRTVRRPLGRTTAHVTKDAGAGESFAGRFTVIGATTVQKLIDILDSGSTLRVQTPKKSWYVEVSGEWSQSDHVFEKGEQDARVITAPFVEVNSPYVPRLP